MAEPSFINAFSLFLSTANVVISLFPVEETADLKNYIEDLKEIMKDLTNKENFSSKEDESILTRAKSIIDGFYNGKTLTKGDYLTLKEAFDKEMDMFKTSLNKVKSNGDFNSVKTKFLSSYAELDKHYDFEMYFTQIRSGSQPSIKEFVESWSKLRGSYFNIIENSYQGALEVSAIDFLVDRLDNNLKENTEIISVSKSGKLGVIKEIEDLKETTCLLSEKSGFDNFVKSWNAFYDEYVDKEFVNKEENLFKCFIYKNDAFCKIAIDNLIDSWNKINPNFENTKSNFYNKEADDFNSFLELLKEKIK